ncbi:MAG: hypothetical protein SP1CHLAM54_13670 [Chlamydiia bacterium]|nr:hypothetical protein [Chlamydiia bacterium]MCH9616260.1 hypothetical protein [Chlamydiia bacterium]MCH9629754.1 hypothetical protein [Chlamydiia bacterium]
MAVGFINEMRGLWRAHPDPAAPAGDIQRINILFTWTFDGLESDEITIGNQRTIEYLALDEDRTEFQVVLEVNILTMEIVFIQAIDQAQNIFVELDLPENGVEDDSDADVSDVDDTGEETESCDEDCLVDDPELPFGMT